VVTNDSLGVPQLPASWSLILFKFPLAHQLKSDPFENRFGSITETLAGVSLIPVGSSHSLGGP